VTFITQGSGGSDRPASLGRQFLCTGARKQIDNLRRGEGVRKPSGMYRHVLPTRWTSSSSVWTDSASRGDLCTGSGVGQLREKDDAPAPWRRRAIAIPFHHCLFIT